MSEAEPPVQERRRQSDATAAALTGSSPDINAIFQSLVDKFIALKGILGAILAWWLSNIWILCAFGVTALLASIPFVDKVNEGKRAERQFQLDMFKVQSDVEMKKLDRTLLGEGAMGTLNAIATKLDQQAEQTTKIQMDVQRLAGDVQEIQKGQAKNERRIGTLQEAIKRIPPPPP